MAKFRKNHNADQNPRYKGQSDTKKKTGKYIIWFFMILGLMYILTNVDTPDWDVNKQDRPTNTDINIIDEKVDPENKNFLPESTTGEIIHHKYYTLSYSEEHEQPEWVAYKLTEESLRKPNVKRAKRFNPDKAVSGKSAYHGDYTRSGYTRGHMAPAGDMAFSDEAMRESFYMSNMTPQLREFNGGIWRELEETVRDWAFDNDELYIVSGPVLTDGHIIKQIGKNKVSVSDLNYKIILDNKGTGKKMIAFLMPNEKSTKPIKNYIASVDEIEELVGINFFADFLDPSLEAQLEASKSHKGWKFDTKRFEKRIRQYNNN